MADEADFVSGMRNTVSTSTADKFFKQTNNITIYNYSSLLGAFKKPEDFYGVYNGAGHTLTLRVDSGHTTTVWRPLFGSNNYGVVNNLNISLYSQDNYIYSSGTYFGFITGTNYGTIKNVKLTRSSTTYINNRAQYFGFIAARNYSITSSNIKI